MEVALRVHEPDADERHAKIAGFFAVIAGQHAKTARVDRQRLVQGEFGRKVCDRVARQMRQVTRPPGVMRRARCVERGNRMIVERQELRIVRRRRQSLGRNDPEHPNRIVRGRAPERRSRAAGRPRGLRDASSTRDRRRVLPAGECDRERESGSNNDSSVIADS